MEAATPPDDGVLIVEDDDDLRDSLADYLRDEGIAVGTAADGFEALARLKQMRPPRLILLDLMLPRMTGAEFRNSLKADASLADVPVVLLSALPDIHTHAAAMGVDGYLRKPVDGKLLLAVVEGYCR